MENYYIKFIEGDERSLKDAIQIAEDLGYKIGTCEDPIGFTGRGMLTLNKDGYYVTSLCSEEDRISLGFKEIKLSKKLEPGTKVKIMQNKTGHKLKILNIYFIRSFDHYDSDAEEFIYNIEGWFVSETEFKVVEDTTFKIGDVIKFRTGNTRYVITSMSSDAISYKHLKHGGQYGSYKTADIEVLEKTYEDYVSIKDKCLFILDTPEWKKWIKDNVEPTNVLKEELYAHASASFAYALDTTLSGTNTGCIDYAISYLDTSTCTVNKQGEIKNTLPTNNNTMEKLNQLRADKFFANEKNLVAIESLDELLKDAIELISATGSELGKVQNKLNGLNRKLESATNNQDVAMLKDLIASTKVVQEFVDELKGKTISKFETAKTKFDVAGYLKD